MRHMMRILLAIAAVMAANGPALAQWSRTTGIEQPNTGTDSTLDVIVETPKFQSLPRALKKAYFSNASTGDMPTGVDTNPCTFSAPCLTESLARTIAQTGRGFELIFDQGDTWSALGDVSTANCPSTGIATGTPCFVVSSSDQSGSRRVTFDGNGLSAGGAGVFFGTTPAVSQTAGALWAMQNVNAPCSHANCKGNDVVNVGNGTMAVVLNSLLVAQDSSLTATGHAIVSKDNGTAMCINCQLRELGEAGGDNIGAEGTVAVTEADASQTATIVLINTSIDNQDTDTGNGLTLGARVQGQSKFFWLRGSCSHSGGSTDLNLRCIGGNATTLNDGLNKEVTLARVLFAGLDSENTMAAIHEPDLVSTGERQFYTLRQVTFAGSVSYARYFVGTGIVWDERFGISDELDSSVADSLVLGASALTDANASGKTTISILDVIYDDDDSGGSVRRNTTNGTCAQSIVSDLSDPRHRIFGSESAGVTNCAGKWESGGSGVNGDVFGGTGGVDNDGQEQRGLCASGAICRGAMTASYSLTMPVEIPAFVLGASVGRWKLSASGDDFGAYPQ